MAPIVDLLGVDFVTRAALVDITLPFMPNLVSSFVFAFLLSLNDHARAYYLGECVIASAIGSGRDGRRPQNQVDARI
jgi:hypothetical protein